MGKANKVLKKKKQKIKKPKIVAKSALLFGSGTLSSRIFGLIRDAILFAVLPLDVKDAWIAAYRLPNFFRRLLGEGGLSPSFIPIFVESHKSSSMEEVRPLINGVFTLLSSVAGLICLVCLLNMDSIVNWWLGGAGFTGVEGKIAMTVRMGQIMFGLLFCMSLFAYFMALLNGIKKFTLTGFAPALLNISVIAALLIFRDSLHVGYSAAWGVLIGGLAQALVLAPSLMKEGIFPRVQLSAVGHPLVKKVMKKFVPTVFAVGVLQIMAIINTSFASTLSSGAITYIYLGDRLLELPLSLIAVSIGTALLPTLSGYWVKGRKVIFLSCVRKHVQLFYFLALPAAFGLWFLGEDIIRILFVRREFTLSEVPLVADIMKVYCLTLICAGSLRIFNQAFYATQDTLTPAYVAVFGLVVHILMAPFWMSQYGVVGLCLSTALTTLLNLCVCFVLVNLRIGRIFISRMIKHFLQCLIASGTMGVFLYGYTKLNVDTDHFLTNFALILTVCFMGACIYFMTAQILGIKEVYIFRKIFGKRRRKKRLKNVTQPIV